MELAAVDLDGLSARLDALDRPGAGAGRR